MTLANRVRHLIDGVPDGGSVSLPVECLRAWLAGSEGDLERDMTVANIAELFHRSPVTVRAWIRAGRLRAYRFRGREYRVSSSALEAFVAQERERSGDRERLEED